MYSKEELKFLNMKVRFALDQKKVFSIEEELSIDEKIKFIDELENGVATYLLNIFNKWKLEKDSLPKDKWNDIKTVSKKAWIKRNDERKLIDDHYKIGSYHLLGTAFKEMSLICPTTEYGYQMLYTNKDVVNQWFHDLCTKLYREEKIYFESINPFDIKIKKIQEYANRYGILDNIKINNIKYTNTGYKDNLEEKELDIFIATFEKIEKYFETTINEMNQELLNVDSVKE